MATLTLERKSAYEFLVRFDGESVPPLTVEEGPPLGEGRGPAPDALLGAAVGSCLAASLVFCLQKSHIDIAELRADVDVEKARNEAGRLRIGTISASLNVRVPAEQRERFERCRSLFEQFCTVTESVRRGITVNVAVTADQT